MAEPGDPPIPDDAPPVPAGRVRPVGPVPTEIDRVRDHDDLIGFASAAGLAGRARDRAPQPRPTSSSDPDPIAAPIAAPEPTPVLPDWAVESEPSPRPSANAFGRPPLAPPATADGAMGLYAVYALILFAVPTLGVSALIALLAVTGRPAPEQPLARSHFIFQQRTLWAAAVAALAGGILIVVNLGVFVLFAAAVWVVVRGAWGVLALKSGTTIAHPRTWLI